MCIRYEKAFSGKTDGVRVLLLSYGLWMIFDGNSFWEMKNVMFCSMLDYVKVKHYIPDLLTNNFAKEVGI